MVVRVSVNNNNNLYQQERRIFFTWLQLNTSVDHHILLLVVFLHPNVLHELTIL